nr:hypothetical protein [Frankia sp. AgPm24]
MYPAGQSIDAVSASRLVQQFQQGYRHPPGRAQHISRLSCRERLSQHREPAYSLVQGIWQEVDVIGRPNQQSLAYRDGKIGLGQACGGQLVRSGTVERAASEPVNQAGDLFADRSW